MPGKVKSLTFEQLKKIKSKTDWERVRNEEPDMTDPDVPDFSEIMTKVAQGNKSCESSYVSPAMAAQG